MFDSIFGTAAGNYAAQSMLGQATTQNPMSLANSLGNASLAQQQMAQYNRYAQQRQARWMINGEVCYSVKDFAKRLFPEDEQAQLMLILKFGDV